MAYVNINRPSAPLRGFAGLGALPRPVQRLRVKNLLPGRRGMAGLGYAISATPPYFTPDPETVITITPTNGMSPFPVVSTESYLQKNLVGMLQSTDISLTQFPNAPGATIARYTLAQWIADFTQQAQQRCSMYPGSCGSSTPEQLGQKYGAIGYQIMQMKPAQPGSSASAPASTPVSQTSNTPGAAPVASVSISDDQTGSGSQMRAGDTFTLRISGGQAGAAVNVSVNGSVTRQGTTDGSGNFVLQGTVPNSPGTQSQQWTVGGVPTSPASISFTIVAPPSSTPAASSSPGATSSTPPASSSPGATSSTPAGSTSSTPVVTTPSGMDLSFLTNPVSILGYGVPLWMLLAGAGVGIYALSGSGSSGGRRR